MSLKYNFESPDPIYVFGSNQSSEQTARMTELYRAVNSVKVKYHASAHYFHLLFPTLLDTPDKRVKVGKCNLRAGGDDVLTEESGEAEGQGWQQSLSTSSSSNKVVQKLYVCPGGDDTIVEGDGSGMTLMATPIRIIAHPHAKSFVWQHFGFVPLGDPDRRRVLCLRELPYCGNTTNLQYYLQRYHRDVIPAGMRELRPSLRTARRASRKRRPADSCRSKSRGPSQGELRPSSGSIIGVGAVIIIGIIRDAIQHIERRYGRSRHGVAGSGSVALAQFP